MPSFLAEMTVIVHCAQTGVTMTPGVEVAVGVGVGVGVAVAVGVGGMGVTVAAGGTAVGVIVERLPQPRSASAITSAAIISLIGNR